MRSKVTTSDKSIDNAGIPSDYRLAIAELIHRNNNRIKELLMLEGKKEKDVFLLLIFVPKLFGKHDIKRKMIQFSNMK